MEAAQQARAATHHQITHPQLNLPVASIEAARRINRARHNPRVLFDARLRVMRHPTCLAPPVMKRVNPRVGNVERL